MSKKKLRAAAIALAAKFCEDAQALFDDPAMTDDLYDSELMQALAFMQTEAADVMEETP